jgi:Ca2+/Na+ antiporter
MKIKSSIYADLLNPYYKTYIGGTTHDTSGIFFELVILVYIFCGFAVMCDKYLIPAIEKIKDRYGISERLAGSTILALGSSVSFIASNMNAVLSGKREEFELGLTCILGASIFELTIGLAIGCLLIRKKYTIDFNTIARDILIYVFSLIILFVYINTGSIGFMQR